MFLSDLAREIERRRKQIEEEAFYAEQSSLWLKKLREEAKGSSSRWTTKDKSDWRLKAYFVGGSITCAVSFFVPVMQVALAAYYAVGPVWNFVDSVGGAVAGNADWEAAKNDYSSDRAGSLGIAGTNKFWSYIGMPAFTTAAVVETAKSGTLAATAATGVGLSMALSGVSFAIAMFICAAQSAMEAMRALHRSDPAGLLAHKFKEYDGLTMRIKELKEDGPSKHTIEIEDLEKKLWQVKSDIKSLIQCYGDDAGVKDQLDEKMQNYQWKSNPTFSEVKSDFERRAKGDTKTVENIIHAKTLIAEQKQRYRAKSFDTKAWVMAGVGAGLVGLSLFFPPAAIAAVAAVGVMVMLGSATCKAVQMYQAHKLHQEQRFSTDAQRKAVFEHIGKQVRTGDDSELKDDDLQEAVEQELLACSGNVQCNAEQRRKLIDLACYEQYDLMKSQPVQPAAAATAGASYGGGAPVVGL